MTPRDPRDLFENAVAAVRDESPDPLAREASLQRAARRLEAELNPQAAEVAGGDERIHGCAGFRALLPAYRAGALSEPKRMLLEDHLRECVPCRRAWNELKHGAPAEVPQYGWGHSAAAPAGRSRALAWRLAAGLGGVALLSAMLWLGNGFGGPEVRAEVASIDGSLYLLDGQTARPVAAGESFERGGVLRTAAGSRAVLTLADGSRVELGERAELSLDRRRDGVVLALSRGNVIVEAAEQRRGQLFVRTDDCLVSVVGTIFSVNSGARGSRVSVLDGEVRVRQGSELAVLHPGEQLATSTRLERVPLERDIAWSRNAPAYRERLQALRALGRELDSLLVSSGGRTSTRLLDLAPADTLIWAAAPNLTQSLSDAWTVIEERVAQDPTLAEWWRERFSAENAEEIRRVVADLRSLGAHLGEEIAVALPRNGSGDGHSTGPLLLAEVTSTAGFSSALDDEIARLRAAGDPEADHLRRIEDPSQFTAAEGDFLVWVSPAGVVGASPSVDRLRALQAALAAGGSGFATTPFHGRLAAAYEGGVEWLFAGDAGSALATEQAANAEHAAQLDALGIAAARYVVIESRGDGETSSHRAELSFSGERRGMAAWLAEPAPSGALEFVSPDAQVAIAGLTKAPLEMFDDMARLTELEGDGGIESEARSELGLSLRDDLAAALGGDFAIAIDGPWLPQPAWKVVIEVLDATRLQSTIARLVEAANAEAAENGKPGLVLGEEAAEGQIYHRIAHADGRELGWYVFEDGYLVAAPSRALLAQTLDRRAAGSTLLSSQAFLDRLPSDGEPNFSALVWQNLGASIGDLARLLGDGVHTEALEASAPSGPTLLLAYGGADRISLLATGAPGPLGMSLQSLLAMGAAVHEQPQVEAVPEGSAPEAVETQGRPVA